MSASRPLATWIKAEKRRRRLTWEPIGVLGKDERAELNHLRKEVSDLREDNQFFGKAASFSRRFITVRTVRPDARGEGELSLRRMTRLLSIPTSACYAWNQRRIRGPGPRAVAQHHRVQKVARVFEDSHVANGAPRVAAQLTREGVGADKKTVAEPMRRQWIEAVSPWKFRPVTIIPGVDTHHLPDLMSRRCNRGRLVAV